MGKSAARTLSVGQCAANAARCAYFLILRNAPRTKAPSAIRSSSFFFTGGKLADDLAIVTRRGS